MLISAISTATPPNGSPTPVSTTTPTPVTTNLSNINFSGKGQIIEPKKSTEALKAFFTAAKVKMTQFSNGPYMQALRNLFGC